MTPELLIEVMKAGIFGRLDSVWRFAFVTVIGTWWSLLLRSPLPSPPM